MIFADLFYRICLGFHSLKKGEGMADDEHGAGQLRAVTPGGGFLVACLLGGFGIVAGLILWLAQASFLVILLAYIGFPAVMIISLFLLTKRHRRMECEKSGEEALVGASKNDECGQA